MLLMHRALKTLDLCLYQFISAAQFPLYLSNWHWNILHTIKNGVRETGSSTSKLNQYRNPRPDFNPSLFVYLLC